MNLEDSIKDGAIKINGHTLVFSGGYVKYTG